jgi:hypothetical protein
MTPDAPVFDLARHQDPIAIQRVLHHARTIAIVGLSRNELRASFFVGYYLKRHGYRVIPVNPREKEILGEKSYKSLLEVTVPVDIVNVFRAPDALPAIAEEAVTIRAGSLWCQFGVINEEGARIAEDEAAAKMAVIESQAQFITDNVVHLSRSIAELLASGSAGAEDVAALVLGSAAQAAGGFISLEGAKAMSVGIGEMIATLGASAPTSMIKVAGGLALIGAGSAISVGGPAAISSLMGLAGGSARGGALSRAQSDRGIDHGPRRGRNSGAGDGGGGYVVTITYGVGGPAPEDTARAVLDALATARRRGLGSIDGRYGPR